MSGVGRSNLYPQEVVETAIYPRINTYAFTHKRLRLFGSSPEDTWPGGLSPVFTSISNNPVLITRPLSGYAYKGNNL